MVANDQLTRLTNRVPTAHLDFSDALRTDLAAHMRTYQAQEKPVVVAENGADTLTVSKDILPSGKIVERTDDGFPISGRRNDDVFQQNFYDAETWSKLQQRKDLSEHEKFAAVTMGVQMRRRYADPIRDDIINNVSWDDRVEAAQKKLDTWNKMAKVLESKLGSEERKLETKVSDELTVELWQEQWRQQKFSKKSN